MYGKRKPRLIYLDHAATSWPKPVDVRKEIRRLLIGPGPAGNAGRSAHRASFDSAKMVFEVREGLARLLGVLDSRDLVFTRGATEGLNLVLKGLLREKDLVAVSPVEHNSVMRPLTRLAKERRVRVVEMPADAFGRVDAGAARKALGGKTPRLVAVTHASNVTGAVQDLAAIRRAFPDSALLVDAAQTAGVLPVNVAQDGIDFLAFSAHKGLLGPTGLGGCYLSPRFEVAPLMEGGTGSRSEETVQPDFRPDAYEAGTLNLHGIAGLKGALAHIESVGLLGETKRRLTLRLIRGLARIQRVKVLSPADGSALMVSFVVEGVTPDKVARGIEESTVVLSRAGLHCSPAAHRHVGSFPDGAVRLSPGYGNIEEDIERAVEAVRRVVGGRCG